MRAGLLKYHIQILSKTTEKSLSGAVKETWTVLHAVRADVRYKSGSKAIVNMETFNSQTIDINIRYLPEIDESMQIKLNERLYKIVFISEPEYRRALTLTVERLQENG